MILTRETLFEAVWDSPRKRIAEQWDLNTNTITVACKLHQIPLPPSGYWTRVEMGKPTKRPILQGSKDDLVELIDPPATKPNRKKNLPCRKKGQQRVTIANTCITSPKASESESESEISGPRARSSIAEALPVIRKAYRSYSSPKAPRDFRYKHVLPASDSIIRMTVMPELVERALLIMDTLLREFKANKWNVQIPATKDRSKNSVEVDGVSILFSIIEQRTQEKIRSHSTWSEWEYVYHSTGLLRFQYSSSTSIWHEVKDTKRIRLEDRIDDIIQAIKGESVQVKRAEQARKERERLSRLEDQLSSLVKLALKQNQACCQRLDSYLERFEKAEKIRRFAEAFRLRLTPEVRSPEHEKWLAWVDSKARALDPASDPSTLDLTVPVEITSSVKSMIAEAPEQYGGLQELDLDASIENTLRWVMDYPRDRF